MTDSQGRRTRAAIGAAASLILLGAICGNAWAAEVSKTPAPTLASAPAVSIPARGAKCNVPAAQARLDFPLSHTASRIVAGLPVRIVALGSSSTAGAGASSPSATYPSRLAVELTRRFPGHEFTVLNRGVGGEEAADMMARLEKAVIAEKPHLVIWQVGTNAVLRDRPLSPNAALLHEGIARLKAINADIVLIDPQFAPKVTNRPSVNGMVELISQTGKAEKVDVFHRYAMMRRWREVDGMAFANFLSPDDLHMNDWSYDCLARSLGEAIAEAATRPTATAAASHSRTTTAPRPTPTLP